MSHNVEDLFPNQCRPLSSNQGFVRRTTKYKLCSLGSWDLETDCHTAIATVQCIRICVHAKEVATRFASWALWWLDKIKIYSQRAKYRRHTGFQGKNEAHWISGSLVATAVVLTTVIDALGGLVLEGFEEAEGLKEGFPDFGGFASTLWNEENIIPRLQLVNPLERGAICLPYPGIKEMTMLWSWLVMPGRKQMASARFQMRSILNFNELLFLQSLNSKQI